MKSIYLLLVVFSLCLSGGFAQSAASGNLCQGKVGVYNYDLAPLSVATGELDVSCTDQARGFTYYYRPCRALLNPSCLKSGYSSPPATCQKDSSVIPVYHVCGLTSPVDWYARPEGDSTGFVVKFVGGDRNRQLDIEFICDPSAGVGALEAKDPSEGPMLSYHLKWRTSYACPNPALQCCNYLPIDADGTNYVNKSTCHVQSNSCPPKLGAYHLTSTFNVATCDQCGVPQRLCCFYAGSNSAKNIQTYCTADSSCPSSYPNESDSVLQGHNVVNSCNDCYFA